MHKQPNITCNSKRWTDVAYMLQSIWDPQCYASMPVTKIRLINVATETPAPVPLGDTIVLSQELWLWTPDYQ